MSPHIAELDDAKAKRLGGRTMLIPTAAEVQSAIDAVPRGTTKPIVQMRQEMAVAVGADITCPYAARMAWLAVAKEDRSPWWRITKDGKPYDRLPGGADEHRRRLAAEGVDI